MTPTVKTRKRTKASVIAEINHHLADNNRSVKTSSKLSGYDVDLNSGEVSAVFSKYHKRFYNNELQLFQTENFPGQCGAITFTDFSLDEGRECSILLEYFLRNIRTFVDKTDYGTVVFCTVIKDTAPDNAIRNAWGEPFLIQRNPNTRHIINYYHKII